MQYLESAACWSDGRARRGSSSPKTTERSCASASEASCGSSPFTSRTVSAGSGPGGQPSREPVDRPWIELRQELARDRHPCACPDEPREGGDTARGGCLGGEEHVPERIRTLRSLVRVKSRAP